MPRHSYKRLPVKNDPVYSSYEVAKLINYIIRDGKKSPARKQVYNALESLKTQSEDGDAIRILQKALNNVSPNVEVRPRRLGGASYLVPCEIRKDRKLSLALKWIIQSARARSNKDFHEFSQKLAAEIKDASENLGQAINKKVQTEKAAEANKAFSHLKW